LCASHASFCAQVTVGGIFTTIIMIYFWCIYHIATSVVAQQS